MNRQNSTDRRQELERLIMQLMERGADRELDLLYRFARGLISAAVES